MAIEALEKMMVELGKQVDSIDVIMQGQSDNWVIELSNGVAIEVEWSNNPPRLIFSTYIGQPIPERQMEVFRVALAFNLMSAETGGSRVALLDKSNEMFFMYEIPFTQSSFENIEKFMTWFVKQSVPWTEFVTSEITSAVPPVNNLQEFV